MIQWTSLAIGRGVGESYHIEEGPSRGPHVGSDTLEDLSLWLLPRALGSILSSHKPGHPDTWISGHPEWLFLGHVT